MNYDFSIVHPASITHNVYNKSNVSNNMLWAKILIVMILVIILIIYMEKKSIESYYTFGFVNDAN